MENFPIKLCIYTFCYNNIELLPFIVEYWQKYATKVVVFDNYSNDGSDKFLSQFSWIDVRKYDTNGKFDQNLIQKMKNLAWKDENNGDFDYIMVCDIDEVLYTRNLMSTLTDIKESGCNIICPSYHECTRDTLPSYQKGYLAHEYDGVHCYKTRITKYALFNPNKVHQINYSNNQLTAKPVGNHKKAYALSILHLKMFGFDQYKNYTQMLSYRYIANQPSPYGRNATDVSIFKKLRLENTEEFLKVEPSITVDKIAKKHSYKDIEWTDCEIIHGDITENKRCIVVIPIYKDSPDINENASIKQAVKILGNKYEICLCGPSNLYYDRYMYKYGHNFSILKCNPEFFKGQASYSWLCENENWYKCFSDYEYMLIYQPDGWIFQDNLEYFMDMNYDYIGSPWKKGSSNEITKDMVGNGGVCLRKVSKFTEICSNINLDNYIRGHVNFEDLLFCLDLKNDLNICPVEIAMQFSFDAHPSYWYERAGKTLPMCAHAWQKWEFPIFWHKFIRR